MMDMFTDSDNESYSESTDTDDHDGIESAYNGHAQSILSCLDKSIEKIDDFLAFQRGFVHGDIVCSISDPSRRLGRVVDVDMSVVLETSSGELIEGVNSRKLSRIRTFVPGDYVIHGHWLGRVSRVVDRVIVLLNNGSICEIMVGDSDELIPTFPTLFEDGSHSFYFPGQHVSIKHHTATENVKWLHNSWKAGRSEGTISHIEVGLVHVKWITSFLCLGCTSSHPHHLQDPHMLTLLSCFSYANWQIGDFCTLPFDYKHYPTMAVREPAPPIFTPQFSKMRQSGGRDHLCKEIYSIAKTRIKVDVLWQNGQISIGVDPEALLPVSNIGDHDFWPGQFVMEKVTLGDEHASIVRLLGVAKSVESQEQVVKVKWISSELKRTANFDSDMEEIVSAYELIEHPDASYSLGDIVVRFQNCDNFRENISNFHIKAVETQDDKLKSSQSVTSLLQVNGCNEEIHSLGHDDCANSSTSHIGFVTGFKDECLEVRWASGLISMVHPFEVFCLDRLDELDSSSALNLITENMQMDMTEHVNQSRHDKEIGNGYNGSSNKGLWDAAALLLPLVAIKFLVNFAERLFSISLSSSSSRQRLSGFACLDKISECSSSPLPHSTRDLQPSDENDHLRLHTSGNQRQSLSGDELQFEECNEVVKCGEHSGRSAFMIGRGKPERFKQFDCVIDYLDHHFADSISKNVAASQVKSAWLRRIQQEWSILKEGLPESISVRVYEERLDLLRASITGPSGTPYYHGLFFFDIHLPDDYPQLPPLVHYHSGGLRLNPNLYESGKICLSLLNTWTGNDTEIWNPHNSTILQVLLSLQALVLNEKPYFNEAGFNEQIGRVESERNSINYNENAFLLTCKSMMYILRQPPKHFEALVEEHFTEKARDILLACEAYMDGAQVGSYGSGTVSMNGHRNNSAGFRIMLAKIFPMIISCFTEKGIDCSQFINRAN